MRKARVSFLQKNKPKQKLEFKKLTKTEKLIFLAVIFIFLIISYFNYKK
jgi:cell division protein FtsL